MVPPCLLYHPTILCHAGPHKLPPGLQVDFQPRASALRCDNFSSEPGSHTPAGMSLADELLSGVPRGLRQTAAQENLCVLFQRAGGEENSLLDEESTREAE